MSECLLELRLWNDPPMSSLLKSAPPRSLARYAMNAALKAFSVGQLRDTVMGMGEKRATDRWHCSHIA